MNNQKLYGKENKLPNHPLKEDMLARYKTEDVLFLHRLKDKFKASSNSFRKGNNTGKRIQRVGFETSIA